MPVSLPPRPSLAQLKRQASELRNAYGQSDPQALTRLRQHLPGSQTPSLQDAQLVVAREYGFASWPKMVHHVESLAKRSDRPPGQPHDMDTLRRHFREKYAPPRDALAAICEKHRLGRLKSARPFPETNFMNSVHELEREGRDNLVLKIQFRATLGWSLEQEHCAIHLIKQATDLPVSELCVLDADRDVLPHPYLLASKLSGEAGNAFFVAATPADRRSVSAELGRVNAVLHRMPVPDSDHLPNGDLNEWRNTVEKTLVTDGVFRQEIAALAPDFFPRLDRLLARADLPLIEEDLVLVWPEGDFHNTLVKKHGDVVQITGIYDFQSAAYGSRLRQPPCQFRSRRRQLPAQTGRSLRPLFLPRSLLPRLRRGGRPARRLRGLAADALRRRPPRAPSSLLVGLHGVFAPEESTVAAASAGRPGGIGPLNAALRCHNPWGTLKDHFLQV